MRNVVASSLFVATAVDDISDIGGPGRKCMIQLQPLGNCPAKTFADRYVSLSQWDVAAFRNGGDANEMIFGTPASDSTLSTLATSIGRTPGARARLGQELDNQAVYIQRPQHEARLLPRLPN